MASIAGASTNKANKYESIAKYDLKHEYNDRLLELEFKIERLERTVIVLQNNDKVSRNGISKLQNLLLGLFKKFLSKVTHVPEDKVNLIHWAGLKKIMCNNPEHLSEFSVKSVARYCGTDPTCPACRQLSSPEFDLSAITIIEEPPNDAY